MIHQMATGYNPEISLLQGGTTPILPVQGGGGGLPPTYNANESLLSGGTGIIEPVKGGARVSFAKNLEEEREYDPKAIVRNVGKASQSYALEVYSFPSTLTPTTPYSTIDPAIGHRQRRYESYKKQSLKTQLLYSLDPRLSLSEYESYPKVKHCKSKPPNFFQVLGKKITILPVENPMFWIFPNLRGNVERFFDFLRTATVDGLLKKNQYILFLGNFYPDVPDERSALLFDELLKLKQLNTDRVFCISNVSETLLANGCFILDHLYTKGYLSKPESQNKALPQFFEPDVLVFPNQRLLFRNGPIPTGAGATISVSKILATDVYPESFYIQPSSDGKTDTLETFVHIVSQEGIAKTQAPPRSAQVIRCPTDTMECYGFQLGFFLKSLPQPLTTINLLESKQYLLHSIRTSKKEPFLQRPIPAKPEVEEKEKEPEEKEEKELEKAAEDEEATTEEEADSELPELPPLPKKEGAFKGSPDAVAGSGEPLAIPINLFDYKVRVPTSADADDPVIRNWKNTVFTDDEAHFLNSLQLSPTVLETVFGDEWKDSLAAFLTNITISSCFKDSHLLLDVECETTRNFLRKVYYHTYTKTLNELYEEWGTGKPDKDTATALSRIFKKMVVLPNLSSLSRMGDIVDISKNEFMGNLTGKYLKVHVDLEKNDNPYFADYAELDDLSESRIGKLEAEAKRLRNTATKFKRIYGTNSKNILAKYRTLKKGVPKAKVDPRRPPGGPPPPPPPPPPPGSGSPGGPPPPPPPPPGKNMRNNNSRSNNSRSNNSRSNNSSNNNSVKSNNANAGSNNSSVISNNSSAVSNNTNARSNNTNARSNNNAKSNSNTKSNNSNTRSNSNANRRKTRKVEYLSESNSNIEANVQSRRPKPVFRPMANTPKAVAAPPPPPPKGGKRKTRKHRR
jgi:hypothetical protein